MLTVTAQGLRHLITETLHQLPLTSTLHAHNYHEAAEAITDLLIHFTPVHALSTAATPERQVAQSSALCLSLTTLALTTLRILPTSALLTDEGRTALRHAQQHLITAQQQLKKRIQNETEDKPKVATYGRH